MMCENSIWRSIFLIFLGFSGLAWGLYEDQVGRFDWRHQYVGQVLFMEFDQSSSTSHAGGRRILVGTDQNVVASLNARTGEIGWRQVFERGASGKINDFVHVNNYLVVVTAGGLFIRCFNPARGNLVWEVMVNDSVSDARASAHLLNDESLAVLTRSKVSVRSLSDGTELWQCPLPNSELVKYRHLYEGDGEVTVLGMVANSHFTLVTCNKDGVLKESTSVPAAWVTEQTSCQVVSDHVVCLSGQGSTLQTLQLTTTATGTTAQRATFTTTLLQDFGLDSHKMELFSFQKSRETASVFGLRLSDRHIAVLALEGSSVKLLSSLPGASTAQITRYGDKTIVISLSRVDSGTLELKTNDLWSGTELVDMSLTIQFPSHHGLPQHLYSLVFKKKDGSSGVRALVLSEDHSVALLQQSGKVAWVREEALASIVSMEMVDLPVSQIQQEMEDEFSQPEGSRYDVLAMFARRFSSQFAQLKTLLHQLKNKLRVPRHSHSHQSDEDVVMETSDTADDEEWLTRDEFNLHKMLVATTRAGKLYGLDSLTGLPVWQYLLHDLQPFQRFSIETLPLFVQRTTAHFPHLPQCTVIGQHRVTGQGLLFSFNPIAGTPTDGMPPNGEMLNYDVLQLMMVSAMDDHFLRPLLIVDKDLQFHVYPESDTTFVEEHGGVLYMFTTDVDAGMLKGYGLTHSHVHTLKALELWAVNLQKDSQVITNVVSKRALEQVHSQGIVLGDRSVLYKYLNPNLVVVTTEGTEPHQKGTEAHQKGTSSYINVYLIDAVSGHIVFHCNHKHSKGPVNVVHSENWVLYNYWNQKSRRNEIAVLELYEGQKQSNATAFSSLTPPPPPLVMRQSYIFPGYISHMAATITEKGITSKHILIALESGGILEMPKALLDPRRPLVPTQENKEEGMIPYIPELPRPYEAIINYNQSVLNVRGISTAPAGLESTSLVVSFGLDMFGTRVMPSKMFDVLKEDFDYLFISLVLIGMIALSVISQKLAARKALKRAWR